MHGNRMTRKILIFVFVLYLTILTAFGQEKIRNFNILAIRVEFIEDDIETTNGNGKFDLSDTSSALVDPPPHNRLYFEDHLEALKRYYYKISGGKVIINYDVFPGELNGSYQLPEQMVYYNPNSTEEELDERLSELLRDSFEAFDGEETVDYSLYNCFLVFHAGVGSDFSLVDHPALDPTPSDLPSVYLDFEHLQNTIGKNNTNYRGISVASGQYFITDGLIFPETESKEGIEIGLNGIIAHQFGYKLGLSSLFNTDTGKSGIGKWGLMDVGFGNFLGLIPPKPCAWSRIFTGWERPEGIVEGDNFQVSFNGEDGHPTIYKVSISPEEYFLIENRQRDPDGDSLKTIYSERGVVLEVDDYDWDIPGSGLLIWHIDERIIREKIADNKINADKENRGVDLEEADGAEDIGESFDFVLPGFFTPENGVAEDAFYQGNNTEFSPYLYPNSNGNTGALSHITISDISESGRLMSFSVERDYNVPPYPFYIGEDRITSKPVWNGINADNSLKIFATLENGTIIALDNDGNSLFNSYKKSYVIEINGDTTFFNIPYFSKVNNTNLRTPVVYFNETENKLQVAAVDFNGNMIVWNIDDADSDGSGDIYFHKKIEHAATEPVYHDGILFGHSEGKIFYYDLMGNLRWERDVFVDADVEGIALYRYNGNTNIFAIAQRGETALLTREGETIWQNTFELSGAKVPSVGDITGDGIPEIIIWDKNSLIFLDGSGEILKGFSFTGEFHFFSQPSIGDLDNDGFAEVVICGMKGIYAFNRSGSLKSGFPVIINRTGTKGTICTIPTLCDLNGDGTVEILVGSDTGDIYAFDYTGTIIDGFPLTCGSKPVSSIYVIKNMVNGNLQLFVRSVSGYLFLWEFPVQYESVKIPWGEYLHDSQHTSFSSAVNVEPAAPTGELMPPDKVYNYPNPAEGDETTIRFYLNYPAEVTISIYDLTGDVIDTFVVNGVSQTDNEVIWDISEIQSGVYIAKVEAVVQGKKSIKFVKIAVSK